jgi:hypothetical protein
MAPSIIDWLANHGPPARSGSQNLRLPMPVLVHYNNTALLAFINFSCIVIMEMHCECENK